MASFGPAGGVSVFELCIYLPAVLVALFVCSRHGFNRSSGWVFTLILCLVRIIGACCQLATYQSETSSLLETVVILESVGVSPLLLATLGLLARCVDSASQASSGWMSAIHFRILQLFIAIGLILSIAGGTSSTSSTGAYQVQTSTKAGAVIYLIAFLALVMVAVTTLSKLSSGPSDDERIAWAVVGAFPFILVRIIYTLISVFSDDDEFNFITGSAIIHVFMAVLEEMAVVVIYLAIGWKAPILSPAKRGPIASRPWKGGLSDVRGSRGPIHALVGEGIAAAARYREGEV